MFWTAIRSFRDFPITSIWAHVHVQPYIRVQFLFQYLPYSHFYFHATSTIQIDKKTSKSKYIPNSLPDHSSWCSRQCPGVEFLQHVPLRPAADQDVAGGEGGGGDQQRQRLHQPPHLPIQQFLLLSAQAIPGVALIKIEFGMFSSSLPNSIYPSCGKGNERGKPSIFLPLQSLRSTAAELICLYFPRTGVETLLVAKNGQVDNQVDSFEDCLKSQRLQHKKGTKCKVLKMGSPHFLPIHL